MSRIMAKICLVACVSLKSNRAMKAKDLYISPLFKKAREFAEKNCDQWYILSAEYGLVEPDKEIEPYDKTLKDMSRQERQEWSQKILDNLNNIIEPNDEVTFIAGLLYRQYLVPSLLEKGNKIHIPLEGKGIGKQLQWLKQALMT